MKSSAKQSFITGTMILLLAGVINRILGFVPRILLPRVISAEGIGLYQMGYPFLSVVLTLISGGIPLAIAKLVAEAETQGDERRVKGILRLSMGATIWLGIGAMAICVVGGRWITQHLLTDARVYYTFLCMSPILLLAAVSSIYRGYFQGRQNMIPTASSQVVETVVRCCTQLIIAWLLLPYGVVFAAAGAMAGVTLGEVCGMITLWLHYRQHKRVLQHAAPLQPPPLPDTHAPEPSGSLIRSLLRISMPVTGSRLVGSFSYFFEQVMIVQSLAFAGVAAAVATAQYGSLQGMVIPVLLLPNALTYSLSVSLVPSLSEAAARGDMRTIHKRLHQSIRLALVTGAPFAVIMFVLASPLCYVLFHDAQVGAMLKLMAPLALFQYCQGPLQATLQALDKPGTALTNTLIGAMIKLILIYLLATRPDLQIYGAVWAININILLVTVLHWHSVARFLKFRMKPWEIGKVAGVMAAMGLVCHAVYAAGWFASTPSFLLAMALGTAVYFVLIFALGMVDRHDLARLPWIGPKLVR